MQLLHLGIGNEKKKKLCVYEGKYAEVWIIAEQYIGEGGYLFFLVTLFAQIFTSSSHFCSAHSVFLSCKMLLCLRF